MIHLFLLDYYILAIRFLWNFIVEMAETEVKRYIICLNELQEIVICWLYRQNIFLIDRIEIFGEIKGDQPGSHSAQC